VFFIDFAEGTTIVSLVPITTNLIKIPSIAISSPIWLSATTFGVAAEDENFYVCTHSGDDTAMAANCVAATTTKILFTTNHVGLAVPNLNTNAGITTDGTNLNYYLYTSGATG